eukprot:CAMPEP_0180314302 /NCGR_PEP_ID=MMETSP0988-20121125/31957_1 /TAXON_ID=697907 /ORGANISM="non described non described, Strain CCMP2293" /LENGTH=45 /DNA_ID= /DNA_START= /DNA_END= /DNA_ORIENTATION=
MNVPAQTTTLLSAFAHTPSHSHFEGSSPPSLRSSSLPIRLLLASS